ncbi:MAG TPA: hypothetical protein DCY07_04015 [Rhodospirillaceae bacterium]|nr:hypothetical protein [Rhodospirillaceae bacterium]
MNQLTAYTDHSRAVSMKVAPFQDDGNIPLRVTMDNGEAMTVMCSPESLITLQDELQRRLISRRANARAQGITDEDADGFNDNAAGS